MAGGELMSNRYPILPVLLLSWRGTGLGGTSLGFRYPPGDSPPRPPAGPEKSATDARRLSQKSEKNLNPLTDLNSPGVCASSPEKSKKPEG
jgi:hypothetical protein